jgi:hypothetical protein
MLMKILLDMAAECDQAEGVSRRLNRHRNSAAWILTGADFYTPDEPGIMHVYETVSRARDLFASGDGIPEIFF